MMSFWREASGTSIVTVCSLRVVPQQMSIVGFARGRAHQFIPPLNLPPVAVAPRAPHRRERRSSGYSLLHQMT